MRARAGGESPTDVAARADLLLAFADGHEGDAICFAHAHMLRAVVARWIGLGPEAGGLFIMDTATVSVFGHERRRRISAGTCRRPARTSAGPCRELGP
jgi:probable phosphoglycerate mutase